jgi:hypothetical protein
LYFCSPLNVCVCVKAYVKAQPSIYLSTHPTISTNQSKTVSYINTNIPSQGSTLIPTTGQRKGKAQIKKTEDSVTNRKTSGICSSIYIFSFCYPTIPPPVKQNKNKNTNPKDHSACVSNMRRGGGLDTCEPRPEIQLLHRTRRREGYPSPVHPLFLGERRHQALSTEAEAVNQRQ